MAGSKPEIGAKIVLDGAEEYQRSLKEVANAQKDLNKEMKLAESEFKKTGDAQQLYNEKVRLLNAQMDNQKKKLETAQKALKELSDKGVDKNSDLWRKWNGILLDSQTKMNNLQAELNSTTAAMKDTADATEQVTQATERATQETADYSETLKSIDKGVKFSNILQGLSKVGGAIKGIITTAFSMGKALLQTQLSGGDWAREIVIEAEKAMVSVEEYQKQQYAQLISGVDPESIKEGINELRTRLSETGEEAEKLHAQLAKDFGITTRAEDGSVAATADKFWEIIDALHKIENEDIRLIKAQQILGEEYKNLVPLLNLGREGYEALLKEGEKYTVVSEKSVNALKSMDEAVDTTKASWEKLKHNLEAETAPGIGELAEGFTNILTQFNEFINSEQGQAVFDRWNNGLKDFSKTIKDVDFSTSLESLSQKVDNIVGKIEDAAELIRLIQGTIDFYKNPDKWLDSEYLRTSPLAQWIDGQITLDDYLKRRRQNDLKIMQQQVGTPTPQTEDKPKGEVAVYSYNPTGSPKAQEPDYVIPGESSGWSGIMQRGNDFWNDQLKSAMQEAESTASEGGENAIEAFNTAVEQEGEKTSKVMKSLVSDAFSGFDSLFASMGNAHGQAYVNALYAQMARVNTMLSLSPSYAYGGSLFTQSAVTPAALAKQNANIGLYVGREKVAEVFTPIIDGKLGADIQTIR